MARHLTSLLHGRQVHFQHTHFLLELILSPKNHTVLWMKPFHCILNATFMLFTKAEISKSCFSLTPTYLYVFMFFRKVQSCHDSFLLFCCCCWPSPSYRKGLSTLLLDNDGGLSLHGLHPQNVHFSFFQMLWVIYRFMVILISLKTKDCWKFLIISDRWCEIKWVERVIEMKGRMAYII